MVSFINFPTYSVLMNNLVFCCSAQVRDLCSKMDSDRDDMCKSNVIDEVGDFDEPDEPDIINPCKERISHRRPIEVLDWTIADVSNWIGRVGFDMYKVVTMYVYRWRSHDQQVTFLDLLCTTCSISVLFTGDAIVGAILYHIKTEANLISKNRS